jgi:predicted extracellular nuclease
MSHLNSLTAVMLAATALLAACGGGNDAAPAADGQKVALRATVPASKLPACPAPAQALLDITAVQGPGASSPLQGERVSVRGIVTADYRGSGGLGGFYIQQADPDNDPATSEGLFVFTSDSTALQPGDFVQVTGTVAEFRRGSAPETLTQLASAPLLEVCGTTTPVKATTLTLPLQSADEFERTEGMLVRFQQPLYVSGNFTLGRFGELMLSSQSRLYHPNNHPELAPDEARALNARSRLLLDDARSIQNPATVPYLSAEDSSGTRRAGDVVKGLEGVLTYDFSLWRLQPTAAPAFEPRNARTAAPAPVGGTLRVANLNVLNYFTTLGQRGANTATEFQRQQDKLVATIVGLDADVLGLIEIENNNAVALKALVDAVNARLGAPVYSYRSPGVIGGDQITVAVIYKPARVDAIGNPQVPVDPDFAVDGGVRPPVAQRFAARDNGGGFWFVVNHLKSKGGCPGNASSPDQDDGQGCWNASRVRQAQALTRWVDGLVAATGERDVLMSGDFNAYLNEDPLAVLRNAGHENLLGRLPAEDRYTYVFDNETGALDHAFASAALSPQVTGVAVWHTNADEPIVLDYNQEFNPPSRYDPGPYRASDHDPVVVGLALAADAPAFAATLTADLPASGTATEAVAIENLTALPTPGATGVSLTVDWGDGTGVQTLSRALTRAEHVYAAAGRYTITLRLAQDGSLPAELSAPVAIAPAPVVVQAGLYISEYIEGSSFNKAIEIYNPGTTAVDLSLYTLRLYSNGAATASQSFRLSGTLAAGGTYVLCNSGIVEPARTERCNVFANGVINFNGDDALTLEREGAVVDQFGQVGFDPGSAWTGGGLSTVDRTLRRKAGVTQGSVPPGAPGVWDLAAEWDGFPNNTLDGLGTR